MAFYTGVRIYSAAVLVSCIAALFFLYGLMVADVYHPTAGEEWLTKGDVATLFLTWACGFVVYQLIMGGLRLAGFSTRQLKAMKKITRSMYQTAWRGWKTTLIYAAIFFSYILIWYVLKFHLIPRQFALLVQNPFIEQLVNIGIALLWSHFWLTQVILTHILHKRKAAGRNVFRRP